MNITGTFRTTRFSDLLRYYAISKDSATVRVWLGSGKKEPDGIFVFVAGRLTEASLDGAQGNFAIRRALTLREGSFAAAERESAEPDDLDVRVEGIFDSELPPVPAAIPASTPAPAMIPTPLMSPTPLVSRPPFASPPPLASPAAAGAVARRAAPPPMAQTLIVESPVSAAASPAPAAVAPVAEAPPAAEPAAAVPPASQESAPAPEAEVTRSFSLDAASPPENRRIRRRQLLIAAGALVGVALIAAAVGRAGDRSSPPAPVQAAERAATAPAASEAAPATTEAKAPSPRGVLPDTLVLGMVSSFTGSNKERGRAMRIGWEMAIGEANQAGGIHGRKLRLVSQDDGYDPKRTLAGMKAVVEDESAFAIVGNVGTSTAAVAVPYAGQHDAVFFGALSGGDLLRKTPPDRHVFNFRASLAREGEVAVRYLVNVRRTKPQRIAVVAQDDEFGASGRNGALRQLSAYGVGAEHVLQLSYPRNTTDVRNALAELRAKRANVDAVVVVGTYKPAATLVRKARDAGLEFFFTSVSADSVGLAEELVEAGSRYTRGVLVTQVVPVPTSHATTLVRYRQLLEKYAPGEKPGSTSLEAWLGAQVFLEGVRRAGRDLDTAKLIAALESIRDWDIGIGGNITFARDDHQGCDVVWGWLLQPDGTYQQIDLD